MQNLAERFRTDLTTANKCHMGLVFSWAGMVLQALPCGPLLDLSVVMRKDSAVRKKMQGTDIWVLTHQTDGLARKHTKMLLIFSGYSLTVLLRIRKIIIYQ